MFKSLFNSRMASIFHFLQLEESSSPSGLEGVLNLISRVVGTLSILGCIFNISVAIYFRKSELILGKMVILLAISDILSHLPWVFFSFGSTTATCQIGSWISYFGFSTSIFYTTCVGHILYRSLNDGSIESSKRQFFKYVTLANISGFIVGTLSVITEYKENYEYGNGLSTCRTRPVSGFKWGDLLIEFIPGTVGIIACTFYYIRTMQVLKSLSRKQHWGLLVYPLILVICISPTMVRRFLNLVGITEINGLYREFARGLFGAQGFLNSLVYGLSREIRGALKKCCTRSGKSVSASLMNPTISMMEETREDPDSLN